MGRRSYAAAIALATVIFVLLFAASRPNTQTNVLQWDPGGCVRRPFDSDGEIQSATDDDWDFADVPAEGPGPMRTRSDDQILDNEESVVLNRLAPGGLGRVPTYASRSSVLAQRQLLERLYSHDMGFPEERLRRAVSYAGSPERLHRALHKLIRGDAVTVATVGGSVTAGVGAETQNLSYRERLFYWIRTTFPNNDHVFANGALAAAPSSYMSQCIRDYAPEESDIVFVEFTMNDGQNSCEVTTDGRKGFEVLLRKLLAYPKGPAVVVLHWWSPMTQDFWVSPEDQLDVFNKFYGLPSLSWRDATHDLISANTTGFTSADLYFDKAHPNGYNGHRYFADIIIGFLRNEAASLILSGLDVSAEPAAAADLAPLPAPMHPGNYEGKSTCLRDEALQQAVVSAEGFDWKNDGSDERPKWGYTSWHTDDQLLIRANTQTYRGNSLVLIGIGILKSYEHMGIAELTCVSGCKCESRLLDGRWDSRTSQTEWEYHSVGQSKKCLLSIRNTGRTSSGEHKVKVNAFLVTDLHGSAVRWFSHIDDLKDQYVAKEARKRRKAEEAAAKQQEADSESAGGQQSESSQPLGDSASEGSQKTDGRQSIGNQGSQRSSGEQRPEDRLQAQAAVGRSQAGAHQQQAGGTNSEESDSKGGGQ